MMTLAIRPTQGEISTAVELACRAPSIHNSQPWRWKLSGSTLNLFTRRDNGLPATDPTGREITLSMGVVLGYLQMAMEGRGWRCDTTLLPDPNHGDHVAEIMFRASPFVTDAQRRRIEAIGVRRTDRLPMTAPPHWKQFCRSLDAILEPSGATLDVLSDDTRSALGEASDFAESDRAYDSRYHAELTWWSHRGEQSSDGIPASALITAAEYGRVGLAREFPAVQRAERHETVTSDAAKVVVLSTVSDDIRDVITCGQALSTVLIESTCAGYATCTVTHVTENAKSRAMIGSLTPTAALPQVLVRIGMSSDDTAPPQTPRRGVDELVRRTTP